MRKDRPAAVGAEPEIVAFGASMREIVFLMTVRLVSPFGGLMPVAGWGVHDFVYFV